MSGCYRIVRIKDAIGFAAEPGLDVIFVSRETRRGAHAVNQARREKGLSPLRICVMGLVLADDGLPLSSTRILKEEVDALGHLSRPVRVAISTSSPAKLEGVGRAFQRVFSSVDVMAVGGAPGPEQPVGMSQTEEGARSRAHFALKKGGADYAVGLEHGIMKGGMGVHVCVILNALGDDVMGHSPGYPMPDWLVKAAGDGRSISDEVERMLGIADIGKSGGVTGLLSDGALTREELAEYAALAALVPWIRSDLYGLEEE